MPDMTPAETLAYLSEPGHDAIVATVSPTGQPHAVPVWYIMDDGDLVFSTGRASVKGRNLAANPKIAVCVSQPQGPILFVSIQGDAEEVTPLEDKRRLTSAIWTKYGNTQPPSDEELQNSLLVRVKARRTVGVRY